MTPGIFQREYWNANGMATAIVAVAGYAGDWAAYIGAQPDPSSERDTLEWVSRHGCKLSEHLARAVFPGVDLVYRN